MSLPPTKPVVRPCTNILLNNTFNTNNTFNIKVQLAPPKNTEHLSIDSKSSISSRLVNPRVHLPKLNKRWMHYQGSENWEGLLDPLDNTLRSEIIRYGNFVESAYRSFDFNPSSPTYATCRFPKRKLLRNSGLPGSGYRVTKNLIATSGIELPGWAELGPTRISTRSGWIGFVAVCHDKAEISRLGRRDVVIALRGTATPLEWVENLRATLTLLGPGSGSDDPDPMVERGFLSLYTSSSSENGAMSLQRQVREEVSRIREKYGDEKLSFTITGHSLGAALATLAAWDVKRGFDGAVTVVSFGGPRVGNRSFRRGLERRGAKVLRIVNSEDVITKLPGFVLEKEKEKERGWLTRWVYADVGCELRLSSRDSPYYVNGMDVATCHDLKTYLHLVDGFVSSNCPFRATARKMIHFI